MCLNEKLEVLMHKLSLCIIEPLHVYTLMHKFSRLPQQYILRGLDWAFILRLFLLYVIITQLKPQIFVKHVQSFFSKQQTKGKLSSSSSHRSFIPPQSSPELLLERENNVEPVVSLM